MLVFLKEGYIAEDYVTYMSLTYEGSLSENDYKYINSVLQDIVLETRPTINNVSAVMQRLRSDDFQKNSILNNTMLDYLLQTKDDLHLKDVIGVARNNFEFIKDYAEISKYRTSFLQRLFDCWAGALTTFNNIDNSELRNAMFLLYCECLPKDVELAESEIELIEDMYSFISLNIPTGSINKLRRYLAHYQLKFNLLLEPTEKTQAVFTYVIENGHYKVTIDNLRVIYGKEFEDAAFTQIYYGNSKVLKYLHPHFEELIPNIPETSIHEEPETIINLINDKEIDFEAFVDYINKQEAQIDLREVEGKHVEELILKTNIVHPTWENVDAAYVNIKAENNHYLAEYVKHNIDSLATKNCDTENADDIKQMLLLETDVFSNEEYSQIVNCFTKKMGHEALEGMIVPEQHMQILIDKDKLLFDKDTFECIERNYSTQILASYVKANFSAFIGAENIEPKESNLLGIEILKSSLRLDEKRQYMKKYPFNKEGANSKEYARLYCFYYEKIGDFANEDINALIAAMNVYDYEDDAWKIKISIVNQINSILKYDKERETQLLMAINEYYGKLNNIGHEILKFDNNPENEELLSYLKFNNHYVSDVKHGAFNKLKVSFRHK